MSFEFLYAWKESEEGIRSLRTGVTAVVSHHWETESEYSEREANGISLAHYFFFFLPSILFVTFFLSFYNNQYLAVTITNKSFTLF